MCVNLSSHTYDDDDDDDIDDDNNDNDDENLRKENVEIFFNNVFVRYTLYVLLLFEWKCFFFCVANGCSHTKWIS